MAAFYAKLRFNLFIYFIGTIILKILAKENRYAVLALTKATSDISNTVLISVLLSPQYSYTSYIHVDSL